jgi:hypothetical protein
MSEAKPDVALAEKFSLFTDKELPTKKPARRTALMIIHGMGQQRKFETMSRAAEGIERVCGAATVKRMRSVRFGDDDDHVFSRIEMNLADGRGVDIYEGYWAPVTEGEVTLRDVMSFLIQGAWKGITNAKLTFPRWVFGALHRFNCKHFTRTALVLTLLFVVSLASLNAFLLALAAGRATGIRPGWTASPALMNHFAAMVLMFLAAAAGFGAIFFAAGWQRKKNEELKRFRLVSRLGVYYLIAVAAYTCIFAFFVARRIPAWSGPVFRAIALGLVLIAAGICALAILRSRYKWPELLFAIVLVAIARGIQLLNWDAAWLNDRWPWLLAALLALSAFVRRFFVQYLGDVAAYVTPSSLDRFETIRSHIKKRVFDVADAIYRGGKDEELLYDSVVIAGHSLGSIAAYDVLNRMLNDDARSGGKIGVLKRTTGFVTFGSFLDKTAFIFETNLRHLSADRAALAATVQPLIEDTRTKALPWKNVRSPWDIFTGRLNYYDDPDLDTNRVEDVVDYDALRPIGAHDEYWNNKTLWRNVSVLIP